MLKQQPLQHTRLDNDNAVTFHAHHDSEQEERNEIPVVILSHTVCHKGAVVVEPEGALAARVTVLGARNLSKGNETQG